MFTITVPPHFNANSVDEFLKKTEYVFINPSKIDKLTINLKPLKNISIVGLLLIYKFMDYTSQKAKMADGYVLTNDVITKAWDDYQFNELINAYIKRSIATEKDYKDFKVSVKDNLIIAPQALLRDTNYTNTYLRDEFLPKLSHYYSFDEKIAELIFTCISEILLNFWEHAVDDTKSIILADGTKDKIEIACADTGDGIISNLEPFFPQLAKNKEEILAKSLERGVTSKKGTYHMGYGLWLVNELVNLNRGKLHLYSQGYFYRNDFGKIKMGKTGYWPGSIIYVNLNLKKPMTLSDIDASDVGDLSDLKINFL